MSLLNRCLVVLGLLLVTTFSTSCSRPKIKLKDEVKITIPTKPSVFFINGMLNSRREAQLNSKFLQAKIPKTPVKLIYVNSNDWNRFVISSINAVVAMDRSAEIAFLKLFPEIFSKEDYDEMRKASRAISENSRPIFVAHSYGNIASNFMCRENNRIPRIIHVANPSSKELICSVEEVNFKEDIVINVSSAISDDTKKMDEAISYQKETGSIFEAHSFVSYLDDNSARGRIISSVNRQVNFAKEHADKSKPIFVEAFMSDIDLQVCIIPFPAIDCINSVTIHGKKDVTLRAPALIFTDGHYAIKQSGLKTQYMYSPLGISASVIYEAGDKKVLFSPIKMNH